jgi:alpha-D-xyloside xylohydrolase
MRHLVWLVALAACGDNLPLATVPVTSGRAKITLSDDRTTLVFDRDGAPLLQFHADAFQAGTVDDLESGDSFDPYWMFVDQPNVPTSLVWRALPPTAQMRAVVSTADRLELELDYDGSTGSVVIARAAPDCFTIDLSATGTVAYLRVRPDADASEGFYGLGEWGDAVSHRGKLRPMQMEPKFESESADDEGHVPVPLLIGTRGWGVFVESDRPGAFDVARQSPTRVDITYGDVTSLRVHLFSDSAPIEILHHYFDLTGYPGLPAPWAYGPLLWRDGSMSQAQMVDDISQIRTRHLATSGVWFDRPYATGVETFDFDPVKFPDPPAMLTALHDAGLRYAVWQSPYTAPAGNSEDPAPTQHDYADAHSFFPPVTAVLVNQWGKPIDFTNPDAYAWWSQNLATYTKPISAGGYGVEGFKLDYAEDVVVGIFGQRARWLFADGSDERTMHRGYTLLYHQIHRELLAPEGGFLLTRTGRWGDQQKGMIIWPGDLDASFEKEGDPQGAMLAVGGLPAALIKGIGLSASGFPFYASDTGGYRHSPPNNECWLRWVEANTIASAMEVGDSSSQMPWEFTPQNGRDQHSVDVYQQYASLHLRLYPYAWTYAQQIAMTGHPLVRPFGFVHPEVGQHPDDEYLFGDALLVAPVVTAGATSRDVWFPPGTWRDWWTGAAFDGGTAGAKQTVTAPLDVLPLYLAAGAIIPMLRPTIDTLSPVAAASPVDSFATDAGVLSVRIVPGPMSTFTVYDGTLITQSPNSIKLAPGRVFDHGALFEVIATAMPASIMNGSVAVPQLGSLAAVQAAASGWYWEAATGGTLWIKSSGAAALAIAP